VQSLLQLSDGGAVTPSDLDGFDALLAELIAVAGGGSDFSSERFALQIQFRILGLSGKDGALGILAAELGLGELIARFGDIALALLAVLFVTAKLAAEMIELLLASRQFDLRSQAISVALLASGIELVDATGIVGHAGFGLR
jgi:hypothetical protein